MEATLLKFVISLILLTFAFKLFRRRNQNIPPCPAPALPIIGHFHLLKKKLPHRTFQEFSKKCGPIFSLRFGSRLVVVVSSPSAMKECFSGSNDVVLANRPQFITAKYIAYNNNNMVYAPYGDLWRNHRMLGASEIFSPTRLNKFLSIRQDEVKRLLRRLHENSRNGFAKVDLKSMFAELSFNVIMRMVAGKRYFGEHEENKEAARFRELIHEVFEYAGATIPSDFVPVLRWIGCKSFERRVVRLSKNVDAFLQGLIEGHRNEKNRDTMIDHLLSLQESRPEYYTDEVIKGTIIVLLLGGTDTSSGTIEWAMSHLLNHPEVIEKARAEVDAHVGADRLIDEPDLTEMPYLHNIVLETLRLSPPGPLLVPHEASADIKIGGFDVPRGTMLLGNAWALHRDPTVWDDPMSFKPERFEDMKIESNKFMPFGMGRRSCPGSSLAHRVVGLALGSLIQCFEWERVGGEDVDLTEGEGLSMPKAVPLQAKCKARTFVLSFF